MVIVAEIWPNKKPDFKAKKFVPPIRNQKRQYVYKLLVGKKLCFNFVSPPAAPAIAFVYAWEQYCNVCVWKKDMFLSLLLPSWQTLSAGASLSPRSTCTPALSLSWPAGSGSAGRWGWCSAARNPDSPSASGGKRTISRYRRGIMNLTFILAPRSEWCETVKVRKVNDFGSSS